MFWTIDIDPKNYFLSFSQSVSQSVSFIVNKSSKRLLSTKFELLSQNVNFALFYEIINFMCILSPQRIFISPFFFYGRFDALTGKILTYFVYAFDIFILP